VISQVGDLIMSHIKRKYGIKDYGFILPGHGGILDRFDSVLGVVPLVVILCEIFKGIQLFQ
jgi:phosphatidate cytidylyltransferase